jgi:hypothetical protein
MIARSASRESVWSSLIRERTIFLAEPKAELVMTMVDLWQCSDRAQVQM